MNESKTKTVFQERDEAIWLMNKTSMELNKAKAQLAATEEALAQVQRESAELRERYDKLEALSLEGLTKIEEKVRAITDLPALSPSKQAAVDRGIERAEKVEIMQETN